MIDRESKEWKRAFEIAQSVIRTREQEEGCSYPPDLANWVADAAVIAERANPLTVIDTMSSIIEKHERRRVA